jgi:hypothetical protein
MLSSGKALRMLAAERAQNALPQRRVGDAKTVRNDEHNDFRPLECGSAEVLFTFAVADRR